MKRLLPLLVPLLFTPSAQAADRITDAPFATRSEVIAPHAMAAAGRVPG